MKVLFVHNHYQQRSGEDGVFALDVRAAQSAGHHVVAYTRDNRELAEYGRVARLTLAARTAWAWDTQRELAELIARERPDVAHFVNTLPLVSPAAFWTCQRHGVRTVYNVQNYRLGCPAATFVRDGSVCVQCSSHGLLRGVVHGCYRGSRSATLAVALAMQLHRRIGTYAHAVDRFLVPSRFMAQALVEHAGLDPRKLVVRPNAVDLDPGPRTGAGSYLLFAGRLTEEKGILTLLEAYAALSAGGGAARPVPELRIVGDGPLRALIAARLQEPALHRVALLGSLPHARVIEQLQGALALVVPSQWFEGLPLSLLEAFACGVPVVAARIGSLTELIEDGQTGLSFEPGSASMLARTLAKLLEAPALAAHIGRSGRQRYLEQHTLQHSARVLDRVYRSLSLSR